MDVAFFRFSFCWMPCACLLRDHHTTKRRMKTWNMIKRRTRKNASLNSQMVKNLKRAREKRTWRDPYFCPCDPDHVCQLSITFAWRVIHCWMEQLFFTPLLLYFPIPFIFRHFCLSRIVFSSSRIFSRVRPSSLNSSSSITSALDIPTPPFACSKTTIRTRVLFNDKVFEACANYFDCPWIFLTVIGIFFYFFIFLSQFSLDGDSNPIEIWKS